MSCETSWAEILNELEIAAEIAQENSVEHPDINQRALGLEVSSELTKAIKLLHLVKDDISIQNRKDEGNRYGDNYVRYDVVFKNQTLFTVTSFYSEDRYPGEYTSGQSTDCEFNEEYNQLKRYLGQN
jgi:hypothetical protein